MLREPVLTTGWALSSPQSTTKRLETIDAFFTLSRMEGIIPAIESAHAVAYAMKLSKEMGRGSILINLSGRGDKDMDYVISHYGLR